DTITATTTRPATITDPKPARTRIAPSRRRGGATGAAARDAGRSAGAGTLRTTRHPGHVVWAGGGWGTTSGEPAFGQDLGAGGIGGFSTGLAGGPMGAPSGATDTTPTAEFSPPNVRWRGFSPKNAAGIRSVAA